MARVNILRRVKDDKGWRRVPLSRKPNGRVRWESSPGRYFIEWREDGRRLRAAAGTTPSDAIEAQKRKRLELEAAENGLEISAPQQSDQLPLRIAVADFLRDIKTFRKPGTHRRYEYILELFSEYVAPKSDLYALGADDVKLILRTR